MTERPTVEEMMQVADQVAEAAGWLGMWPAMRSHVKRWMQRNPTQARTAVRELYTRLDMLQGVGRRDQP